MKQHIWAIAFSVCLVGFTAYAALDTFAFASVYQANATEMNLSVFEGVAASSASGESSSGEKAASGESASSDGESASSESSGLGAGSSSETSTEASSEAKSGAGSSSASPASGSSSSGHRSQGGSHRPGKPGSSGSSGSSGSANASGADGSNSTSSSANSPGSAGSDALSGASSAAASDSGSTSAADASETSASSSATTVSDGENAREYSDDNVSIRLSEYGVVGTTVHVADVTVSSAEYLKTAFADDTYGKNVTAATSETAAAHDAILAINGDNYGSRESGYVIRNGVVYRDTASDSDVLCIYADGRLEVVDPSTATAQQLVEQGVWQAFSFGPGLVSDGEISVSQDDEVGRAKASNPRTAIGSLGENHYVFVVSDGRTDESEGLSLYELAQFMHDQLGVECAYNLDGGGSSTMVFDGAVVNNPTTNGNHIKERNVNDIVYIG